MEEQRADSHEGEARAEEEHVEEEHVEEARAEGGHAEEDQVADDLEELLGQARAERDEYLDLAQRTRADFDNYRKRVASDVHEAELRGKAKAAETLLPTLDAFERALQAEDVDPHAEDHDGLAAGLVLVYRELVAALGRLGVHPSDPTGERFDPHVHEAVTSIEETDTESGVIVETVERGYTLDGRVVRAPRVVVAK